MIRRLAFALGGAGVGALLTGLLLVLRLFHAFADETLIARVTTRPLSAEEFELTYVPLPAGSAHQDALAGESPDEPITIVRLRGDQWVISGGIVKWHPWLTAMGLQSYQRPLRLSGQYSRLEEQRRQPPTVYPLAPGIDRLWEWLYRIDPYLPFIEAAYGSSASAYVEPRWVQEIYVTPSGYLIRRVRPPRGVD